MDLLWFSQYIQVISINIINLFFFIMKIVLVLCDVGTDTLYIIKKTRHVIR
jgi:hypothetical protein